VNLHEDSWRSNDASRSDKRLTALLVRRDGVPWELRAVIRWIIWRYERNGNRWWMVPRQPDDLSQIKTNSPNSLSSFAAAIVRFRADECDGVGFVPQAHDPWLGIELKRCRNPRTGLLERWASQIVATLASYCEVSPSATGIVVFSLPGQHPNYCRRLDWRRRRSKRYARISVIGSIAVNLRVRRVRRSEQRSHAPRKPGNVRRSEPSREPPGQIPVPASASRKRRRTDAPSQYSDRGTAITCRSAGFALSDRI